MSRYEHCLNQWEAIFSEEKSGMSLPTTTKHDGFDKGLKWLAEGSQTVLDFGCGNGSLLYICHHFGTQTHFGIDFSKAAIEKANARKELSELGTFTFVAGSFEALTEMPSKSVDALILSNIIDNLYPDDAKILIDEAHRLLKQDGKLLVKLNPHLSAAQIKEWDIKVIEGNLLNDGLILWNNTTEQWTTFLGESFDVVEMTDLYFEAYDQYNRLYCLCPKALK